MIFLADELLIRIQVKWPLTDRAYPIVSNRFYRDFLGNLPRHVTHVHRNECGTNPGRGTPDLMTRVRVLSV